MKTKWKGSENVFGMQKRFFVMEKLLARQPTVCRHVVALPEQSLLPDFLHGAHKIWDSNASLLHHYRFWTLNGGHLGFSQCKNPSLKYIVTC